MFNDYVNNINLIDGMNIQTIPLEVSNELTTTKWLMAIEKKLNEVINIRNNILKDSADYTDEEILQLNLKLQSIISELQNGQFIKDHSITLDKISFDLNNYIDDLINIRIGESCKSVIFYLNDEGYFCCDIPSNWDDITFSTNDDGQLILEY